MLDSSTLDNGHYGAEIELFKALADSTRFGIITLLRESEKSPSEIQERLNKGQSTISQQLKILLQANILTVRKDGINKFYRIKDPQIFTLIDAILKYVDKQKKVQLDTLTSSDIKDILL